MPAPAKKTFTLHLGTAIDLIKGSEGDTPPKEIQVLPYGTFDTTNYDPFTLNDPIFDAMVSNFNRDGVRAGVPIDTDHDGGSANGWVTGLINKGVDGLWATIDWTPQGLQLLKDRIYRFFSPEFNLDHQDPETSVFQGPVFLAGTLTNRPLFKSLEPIVASEKHATLLLFANRVKLTPSSLNSHNLMANELQEVRSKEVTALSDEDKAMLREHKDQLSADEQAKFADVLVEPAPVAPAPAPAPQPAPAPKPEPVQGSENVVISAGELKLLREGADAGVAAKEELKLMKNQMKCEEQVKGMLLVKGNEETGKFRSAAKTDLVSLLMTFSEPQNALFAKVVAQIPSAKMIFSEIGSSDTPSGTATEQFRAVVNAIMASENLPYSKALSKAKQEKPEMFKAYQSEITPK